MTAHGETAAIGAGSIESSRPAAPPAKPVLDRFGRTLGALVVVSLAAIWMIFAGIAYYSYRNEWKQASLVANNVAVLVERDIARTVELYGLSLQAVVKGMANPKIMALPDDIKREVLFDQSATASGLGSILVIDRSGSILIDSRQNTVSSVNLSDRDYFIKLRDNPGSDLVVSRPFMSRTSGEWSIALGRRLDNPDGSFAGIVIGGVRLNYILSLYNQVQLPPDSSMTLSDLGGATFVRSPFDVADIGRQADTAEEWRRTRSPSGEFTQVSGFDAVRRLFVYRRVGTLPLVQSVGLSTDRFLASWLLRIAILTGAFLVLSALIVVLGGTLWRELQRRSVAERALSALATTDGLTGLTNRRRFNELLAGEWRRCARSNDVLSLLMIDCDFFKAFNDTLGHLEGDTALRAIAAAIQATALRPADVSARFGGEEFVVMLPATDAAGAQVVAEAIRTRVVALQLAHPTSPSGMVTVSLGVASLRPSPDGDAAMLVRAADAALYQAKSRGRNTFAVAAGAQERGSVPPAVPVGA